MLRWDVPAKEVLGFTPCVCVSVVLLSSGRSNQEDINQMERGKERNALKHHTVSEHRVCGILHIFPLHVALIQLVLDRGCIFVTPFN